ncbi:hypothetical protein QEZ52_07100 [Aliisedimentitalea scapharcae]|uniref:Uncharacterized protein n=1 Tax=Aliisedimentitalea scapharcae TaxID=1524259 RepID=A0ABZ2XYD2_9RHOB
MMKQADIVNVPDQDLNWILPAPVPVEEKVETGDTFNAGFLTNMSELGQLKRPKLKTLSPKVLEAALSHGARVAAVPVLRAGANPPWAGEL